MAGLACTPDAANPTAPSPSRNDLLNMIGISCLFGFDASRFEMFLIVAERATARSPCARLQKKKLVLSELFVVLDAASRFGELD
jgi:hypothetical protein